MKTKLIACLLIFTMLLPVRSEPKKEVVLHCVVIITVLVGGIYVAYKLNQFCKKHLPPDPPPPAPPATNSLAAAMSGQAMFESTQDVQAWDITDSHYPGPNGQDYHTLITVPVTMSTNLTDWQTLTITGYVSPTFVLLQCGDKVSLQPYSSQWSVDAGLPQDRQRFFRVSRPSPLP